MVSCPLSKRLGGLPLISRVWDFGPVVAALTMLASDFGAICLLMCLEGIPPWQREMYRSFIWNDTIFIPAYMAMVPVILGNSMRLSGFYTKTGWHILLFFAALLVSIALELNAVLGSQYTVSQELSPSKLWHSAIFVIVGYWLASSVVPVIVVRKPLWALGVVGLAVCGFLYNVYLDVTLSRYPTTTHLEGTYIPWSWRVRE
jgi:hypothetical protein